MEVIAYFQQLHQLVAVGVHLLTLAKMEKMVVAVVVDKDKKIVAEAMFRETLVLEPLIKVLTVVEARVK
ncbi:MAG: hypothetical protein EBR82_75515 [Caulobacteraceae bacterium]|nr:hypothetical protein [Caulobacteraceae bacterium]